jgi:CelD/BcsL family acetyltransferase involved in cellulose biosynthesis
LTPEAYLDTHIRSKKRKELRRLANRLGELGTIAFTVLETEDALPAWCDDFLHLESAGWKGERGAALGNSAHTATFFREIIAGAYAAQALDFQRITLDGRPIAMLINFRTPPGSWSFKIAYDESLARYSPGVLIELENLPRVLNDPTIAWMDSCAVADHSMINSFWAERRSIVQVSVPLSGARRTLTYYICRAAETGSAWLRKIRA